MMKLTIIRSNAILVALALAALTLFSCSDNPAGNGGGDGGGGKPRLVYRSGANQTERVQATLADPIVVQVLDGRSAPIAGAAVSFSAMSGSGRCSQPIVTTDENGLASCRFQLGPAAGLQFMKASIPGDSTWVGATAVRVACPEEDPSSACEWPAGHIFIATTGSSLRSEAGSVVIDFDPYSRQFTKVLETPDLTDGISFSGHGELFVSTPGEIKRINSATHELETYATVDKSWRLSLEPNQGGVLAGLGTFGSPVSIGCPQAPVFFTVDSGGWCCLTWESLAANPATRDLFFMFNYPASSYSVFRVIWNGRSPGGFDRRALLFADAAVPRGMCADPSGTLYITFDGAGTYRRIVRVAPDGAVDYEFFDFYAHGGNEQDAGRWGDIAYLDGKLYLIDTRNDRLVIISADGEWLGELKNPAFSRPLEENEHYSICASPEWLCLTE